MREDGLATAATSVWSKVGEQYASAFGLMMRAVTPQLRLAATLQAESVGYAVRRTRAMAELPQRLAACRALPDVMALQKVLLLEATDDGVAALRRVASAVVSARSEAPATTSAGTRPRDYLEPVEPKIVPVPAAAEQVPLVTVRAVLNEKRGDAEQRAARPSARAA
jgi:hypothetical protein